MICVAERVDGSPCAAGVEKITWNTESRGSGRGEPPTPDQTGHYRGDGARNQSPTKAYARDFAPSIPRVFVFSWNVGEGRQVVHRDHAPRWITVEYRTMSDQLGGAKFVREIKLGENVSSFHFRRGEESFLVAWSDGASLETVVKLTATRDLTVTDIMGNDRVVLPGDSIAAVPISYQPVFIHGLGAEFEVK